MFNINRGAGRKFARHLVIALTLAGPLGGLGGCEKVNIRKDASPTVGDKYGVLQADFTAAGGHEQALTQALNDTAQVYWQPDWKAGFDKSSVAGTVYTYVPLSPNVRSIATKRVYYTMKEVNSRRYLLVKHDAQKNQFSLAVYTGKLPITKVPASKLALALAPGRIRSFRTFTGSLFILGLSTNINGLLQYKQGVRVLPKAPIAPSKPGSGAKALEYYNCHQTYVCDYYAYCGPDDRFNGRTVSVVSDYGCEAPGYEPCDNWGRSWEFSGSRSYETCDYRDDPPTPDPDPDPTGTGGTGTVSIESNAEYLLNKPLALYGPCPGLTDGWLTQINFKPPAQVIQKINNLSHGSGMNLGGMPVDWGYFVQSIANAQGTLINLDNHAMFFNQMPVINGQQMDVFSLGDYFRYHLSDLTGLAFTPSPHTGYDENYLWQHSPVGTILEIGIPGDPGSVICSDYQRTYGGNGTPSQLSWTFTTIHDPYVGDHPVSGTRTFILQDVGFGYIFFTQGADRLTGALDNLVGWLTDIKGTNTANGIQFNRGFEKWETMMTNTVKLVDPTGNRAIKLQPVANLPKYEDIQNALKNGQPLSSVPCN